MALHFHSSLRNRGITFPLQLATLEQPFLFLQQQRKWHSKELGPTLTTFHFYCEFESSPQLLWIGGPLLRAPPSLHRLFLLWVLHATDFLNIGVSEMLSG